MSTIVAMIIASSMDPIKIVISVIISISILKNRTILLLILCLVCAAYVYIGMTMMPLDVNDNNALILVNFLSIVLLVALWILVVRIFGYIAAAILAVVLISASVFMIYTSINSVGIFNRKASSQSASAERSAMDEEKIDFGYIAPQENVPWRRLDEPYRVSQAQEDMRAAEARTMNAWDQLSTAWTGGSNVVYQVTQMWDEVTNSGPRDPAWTENVENFIKSNKIDGETRWRFRATRNEEEARKLLSRMQENKRGRDLIAMRGVLF